MLIGTIAAVGLWETGFNVPEVQRSFEVRCETSHLPSLSYSLSPSLVEVDVGGEKRKSKRISGNKLDVIITCRSSLLHALHSDSHTHTHRFSSVRWFSQAGST